VFENALKQHTIILMDLIHFSSFFVQARTTLLHEAVQHNNMEALHIALRAGTAAIDARQPKVTTAAS